MAGAWSRTASGTARQRWTDSIMITTRDKVGAFVLITLFFMLGATLVFVTPKHEGRTFDPGDSPIVHQRIMHLQKSN